MMPPPSPPPRKDRKEKDSKEGSKDEKSGKIPAVATSGDIPGSAAEKPAAEKLANPPKVTPDGGALRKQRFMKPLREKKLLIGGSHYRVMQLFHSLSYLIDFLSLRLVNLSAY
ncbi:hypothetical protein ACJRO7_006764 [Eucalyptus globulus]|uniref:Uncharacterized protein n=1 Tax=Eucalyptus globulus TaxID=34317 RepID=A0ABD3IJQ3_EUCGL